MGCCGVSRLRTYNQQSPTARDIQDPNGHRRSGENKQNQRQVLT